MPRPSSSLRVFVSFKDDTVFAGEDVECTITFKNVDHAPGPLNGSAVATGGNTFQRHVDPLEHLKVARGPSQAPPLRAASAEPQNQSSTPLRRPPHNKSTSSLSIVDSAALQESKELPGGGYHIADAGPRRTHQRRVSIVSIPGSATAQRPNHGRSASVQALANLKTERRRESSGGAANQNQRVSPSPSPILPSPHSESTTPPLMRPSRSKSGSVQLSERWLSGLRDQLPEASSNGRNSDAPPPNQRLSSPSSPLDVQKSAVASSTSPEVVAMPFENVSLPPRASETPSPRVAEEQSSKSLAQAQPYANTHAAKLTEETPRSSVDMYSMSNHSNETLTSEYPAQQTNSFLGMPLLGRTSSLANRFAPPRVIESLMMGYAQLSGSFTLDGSLVQSAPFEEVKRKAVVGGQAGGGVVGITQPSGDGGLFGSFNWTNIGGSIGESIGGLMGGSNLSSIKEMKGIADSSSVPLLSTSKSVLFVDLKLSPGQSKSYSYKFSLPRGLPPSHKGRAIKVTYNLVVGIQRSSVGRAQGQQIKQLEIPFRVFGGVNSHGELLGHDLMSPYIILKDQAQTAALDEKAPASNIMAEKAASNTSTSAAADFQSYVSRLLIRPREDSSSGLLSPTMDAHDGPHSPQIMSREQEAELPPVKAETLIDQAIRDCSNPSSPNYIPTNFSIARSSVPIASLSLSRSALKLGDLMTCVIDFSRAKLPCYAFEATLESVERIDPGLAIRSAQTVERATRRVWARTVENALWARRCAFRAQVPVSATPAFATTGVGLEWIIRLELVVGIEANKSHGDEEGEETDQDQGKDTWAGPQKAEQLLEVVTADERGTVLGAMQRLPCHSFEVTIPLRVFGAVARSGEKETPDDSQGLAV